MKRPVRKINGDLFVGVPLVLPAPRSAHRLDSEVMRLDEFETVEGLDYARDFLPVFVKGCCQIVIGIGLRPVVKEDYLGIVSEGTLIICVDDGPDLDKGWGFHHLAKVKLETGTQEEHE